MKGTVASIAGFYRRIQADSSAAGCLMITGAPGSGKSVLASKLVVDLLRPLREEAGSGPVKVPVWLSLTGCGIDPKTPPADLPGVFRAWLREEISDVYGLRAKLARLLVEEHRVLPVLDGLDELDPARAVAVVNALNGV